MTYVPIYPHCRHCCPDHPAHKDVHTTPCNPGSDCEGAKPITQPDLFGGGQ